MSISIQSVVHGTWFEDYVEYLYSSAAYYENGAGLFYDIVDFREVSSESSASDSE